MVTVQDYLVPPRVLKRHRKRIDHNYLLWLRIEMAKIIWALNELSRLDRSTSPPQRYENRAS